MIITHVIENICFEGDTMKLKVDGKSISVALEKISARLKKATDLERNFYKISPSGYGIHWPLIDEDLATEALLKIADK
jgi:hypothetical protein